MLSCLRISRQLPSSRQPLPYRIMEGLHVIRGKASIELPIHTRDELTASEEALRFGWASWAIHGLFEKLTDCGDAS